MFKGFLAVGIVIILLTSTLGTEYTLKTQTRILQAVPAVSLKKLHANQGLKPGQTMESPLQADSLSNNLSAAKERNMLKLTNAPRPLVTPTYDGMGEAVHPSVIDFKLEHNLASWRGYRYWMAMTPYPRGYDAFENPSLLASNDGLTWVIPAGFGKPLDHKGGRGNFNSDPNLVYDPDERTLIIYWREYSKGQYEKIWRIKIHPSGVVDPKELCLKERWLDKEGLDLSPTIWRKSPREWYMWTANGKDLVHLFTSTDGKTWGTKQRCSSPWNNWNGGYLPWHLEAKPNYREKRIEFFIAGWSKHGKFGNLVLLYAEAPMNDLTNLSMPLPEPILGIGKPGSWDDDMIYKTSFTIEPEQASYKYHVWYSARSLTGLWHTGYTEGHIRNGL
ncbi:MAG: hypothetical protein ACYCVD_03610 [Desulfitobacteriaceae bacterium]